MLNPEINEFTVSEELTQIASYFAIVDNAIKASDTNKRYKISTNNCEGAPAPFKLGSWCSVPISPQGDNMIDLYNSFITVEIDLGAFKTPANTFPSLPATTSSGSTSLSTIGFKEPSIWVGFKDAMDIVCQYQLVANGQAFYTQSFAVEESYITSLATTEQVKQVDPYSKTRHEDVWNGSDNTRTGCLMNYTAISGTPNNADNKIKLKIDLRRFLPLATIKYLPEFVGNLELRLKFGLEGLVCAPIGYDGIIGYSANATKATIVDSSGGGITNKFVPYAELEAGHVKSYTSFAWDSSTLKLTTGLVSGAGLAGTPTIVECRSHLACFGLDINIYNQLAARYEQMALSFPIQTLTVHQMNGKIDQTKATATGGHATTTLTLVPRFVDSIFLLFPQTSNYHTCYDNILAKDYSLKMGGYGSFPEVLYSTYSPEFIEVSSNVFNVNNDLTGFNKDVIKSLVNSGANNTGYKSFDTSNFILAIPTSTDNTFQQGQTSNTTINYQLVINFDSESPLIQSGASCVPFMCLLKDSVLAIQRRPGGAPPIITLDEYDITTPAQ